MALWLLCDGNYLSHRAKHSTGDFSFEGLATGVAFGVIRDLDSLMERFQPDLVVLAFDSRGVRLRQQLLPTYKSGRKKRKTEEDLERDAIFYPQVDRLQDVLLPQLGYRNIIEVAGYEADDVIAGYSQLLPDGDEAVIVSADKDLYQCLDSNVDFYNPSSDKILTQVEFKATWGINPVQWADVKAWAGCDTDDVPGIEGIGEKTAASYLAGTLKAGKKRTAIESNPDVWARNLPLVKLPFSGLRLPKVVADELSEQGRAEVLDVLGIKKLPRARRKSEVSKLF